ncbi:MAG: hypothetical protein NZ585_05630 [Chloracidobacterium sp.]|nr:hypothetical protein [Chloracidobacterium sp.]
MSTPTMFATPPAELFEPYERLIPIEVLGRVVHVPENNVVLRGFQFLDLESISYGDFCWNGDCTNCQIRYYRPGEDRERPALSCRIQAREGMRIVGLSKHIRLRCLSDAAPPTAFTAAPSPT